jgi:hypothetical protein
MIFPGWGEGAEPLRVPPPSPQAMPLTCYHSFKLSENNVTEIAMVVREAIGCFWEITRPGF